MRKRRNSFVVYVVAGIAILLALFYESFVPRNVENVTVVSGVGIERCDDGNIKLTVQITKPKAGSEGTSQSSAIVLTGTGKSVTEATEAVSTKSGSSIFWAHCAVILIKEDFAANENVMPHLDMFFRSMNFRNTATVLVCKESPEDVFNAGTVYESISAFGIQKLLNDDNFDSNTVNTTLKDFTEAYYSNSHSSVVAGIKTEATKKYSGGNEESSGDGASRAKIIVLDDSAVFRNGVYVSRISSDIFDGYKWLSNTIEARIITLQNVTHEDGTLTEIGISLFNAKTYLSAEEQDGKNVLKIKITATAEVISDTAEETERNITKDELNERFDLYRTAISQRIKSSILACKRDMTEKDCDYCGIYRFFYGKFGSDWVQKWDEKYSKMLSLLDFTFEFDITVISGGLNKRYKL